MHDSVPSARYSSVCNVLYLWRISLIPTYRVYRLYDIAKIQAIEQTRKLALLAIINEYIYLQKRERITANMNININTRKHYSVGRANASSTHVCRRFYIIVPIH